MLGVLENWPMAYVFEGEWWRERIVRQEVREGRGAWEGSWKGVELGEPVVGMFEEQWGGQGQWNRAPSGKSRERWNQRGRQGPFDVWPGRLCQGLWILFKMWLWKALRAKWYDQSDRIPPATMLRRAWKGSRAETGNLVWRLLQWLGNREQWHGLELWQPRGEKCRFQIYFEGRAHRNHRQAIHLSTVCYCKSLEATGTLRCRRLAIIVYNKTCHRLTKEQGSSLCINTGWFSRYTGWKWKKAKCRGSVYGASLFGTGKIRRSETNAQTRARSLDVLLCFLVFVLAFQFSNLGSIGGRNLRSIGGNLRSILLINKILCVRGGRCYGELSGRGEMDCESWTCGPCRHWEVSLWERASKAQNTHVLLTWEPDDQNRGFGPWAQHGVWVYHCLHIGVTSQLHFHILSLSGKEK